MLLYFFTLDLFQVRTCLPCVQVATPPIVPAGTWHPKQLSRSIYEAETRSLDRQEFSLNQPRKYVLIDTSVHFIHSLHMLKEIALPAFSWAA